MMTSTAVEYGISVIDEAVCLVETPAGAHPEGPLPRLVDLPHLVAVVEDRRAAGEIGSLDDVEELLHGRLRVFEQRDRPVADLSEVEGTDLGSEADGDAEVRGDEDIRERRRKELRLGQRVVEVRDYIDGILVDPAEDLRGERLELDLGIAGLRGSHVPAVMLAERAFRIDERVQERFVVPRQTDERVIDRHVAVRVELHRTADDIRALCPRRGGIQKSHPEHRVEQLPV